MTRHDQLPIPDPVEHDPGSFQLLSVWIASGNQHIALRAEVWDDPAAWGLMLADLARHIASTYELDNGTDRSTTLKRLKAGFDVELGDIG